MHLYTHSERGRDRMDGGYCQSSPWTSALVCGTQGECIVVNETMSYCKCNEGYSNDYSFLRQGDCTLPHYVLPVIDGIVGVSSFILFIYSILVAKSLKLFLFKVAVLTSLANLASAAFCLSRFIEGHKLGRASLVFNIIFVSLIILEYHCIVFSVLQPIYDCMQKPTDHIIKIQASIFTIFRVCVAACIIYCIINETDTSTTGNRKFSDSISFYLIFIFLEALGIVIILEIYLRDMIKLIESIQSGGVAGQNLNGYLQKCKRIRFDLTVCATIVILLLIPMIFFQAGYRAIPYAYILYSLVFLQVPPLQYIVLKYIQKERPRLTLGRLDQSKNQRVSVKVENKPIDVVPNTNNSQILPVVAAENISP